MDDVGLALFGVLLTVLNVAFALYTKAKDTPSFVSPAGGSKTWARPVGHGQPNTLRSLHKQVSELGKEMSSTQKRVDDISPTKRNRLEDDLSKGHKEQVKYLVVEFEAEMQELKKKNEQEIHQIKKENDHNMNIMEEKYQSEIKQLQKQHRQNLEQLDHSIKKHFLDVLQMAVKSPDSLLVTDQIRESFQKKNYSDSTVSTVDFQSPKEETPLRDDNTNSSSTETSPQISNETFEAAKLATLKATELEAKQLTPQVEEEEPASLSAGSKASETNSAAFDTINGKVIETKSLLQSAINDANNPSSRFRSNYLVPERVKFFQEPNKTN